MSGRIIVEAMPAGWSAFLTFKSGARRSAQVVIPFRLDQTRTAEYLDDLFHEFGAARHPSLGLLQRPPLIAYKLECSRPARILTLAAKRLLKA
ncbi:MAG: hypothetical protein OEU49_05310 [Chromatiales bacterium]|nr:hypothetical protein [Chromatiales bacterium]